MTSGVSMYVWSARCARTRAPVTRFTLGSVLHVVPMSVRQPELRQLAAFLRQQGLDPGQDAARGVHQHRLAQPGLGQQIANGLDRAGRQHMDFHVL